MTRNGHPPDVGPPLDLGRCVWDPNEGCSNGAGRPRLVYRPSVGVPTGTLAAVDDYVWLIYFQFNSVTLIFESV